VKEALYPETYEQQDFSYERVRRLLDMLRGEPVSTFSGLEGFEVFSDRVQPHSAGLARRMWYGGASLRSAQWAGENRMNFLTSNVTKAEESENFVETQLSHINTLRAHHPDGKHARVSQGLVVVPTDSASAEQCEKYLSYAENRTPRTATPQGPARLMFAVDLVGTSEEIVERLYSNTAFQQINEVAFALPFSFDHDDYVQILTDIATKLGPALGWRPAS
jgi:alkanesulfonate monooxygenase SsuD/methylene tetrahydromethanopterin reductase-like flavin-dependent oxidoreductase (luciferase family)